MNPELRDLLLEHHKAAYIFQLEKTEKLRDRVSFLTGLLTLLGGALLYLGVNYPHEWKGCASLFFYVPCGISAILFLVVVGKVLYALGWGFKYSYIPSPQELQEYAETQCSVNADPNTEEIDLVEDLKENMTSAYCGGATHNLKVNQRRAAVLLRATQIAIVCFVFLLSGLPRFFIDLANKDSKPTEVILIKPLNKGK